jgi:hypothetical protein
MGTRNGFISESRAELIGYYALDAFEQLGIPTLEGWDELSEEQAGIVFVAVKFGARAACTVLGETGTYEEEYRRLLEKWAANESAK